MLVLIGNQWLEGKDAKGNRRIDDPLDYVRFEVETALKNGTVVIPVLLRRSNAIKQFASRNIAGFVTTKRYKAKR